MSDFTLHAVWILIAAFLLSFAYEIYRATAKLGISRFDGPVPLLFLIAGYYSPAAIVVFLLVAGVPAARHIALGSIVAAIVVSIVFYNRTLLPARRPGLVDFAENIVFTGLLFVAGLLLTYDLAGWRLTK